MACSGLGTTSCVTSVQGLNCEWSHMTELQSRQGLSHKTVTLAHCIRPHDYGTGLEL